MSSPIYAGPTQPYGAPPPPPPKQSNGFAVAALIFGIIGGALLGLIFGFIGLARASKVGGKGRAMSWIGIVLSILWIVGIGALVATVGPNLLKATNPGCSAAKKVIGDGSNITAAGGNAAALKTELQTIVTGLNDAAAKSTDAEATTAIRKLATDYKELLDALNGSGTISPSLDSRIVTDAQAVDKACGTIGT